MSDKQNVLVFAGGLGLGAYHAGVYEAFSPQRLDWVCGASVGAVTSALIAGNRSDRRVDALRTYWNRLTTEADAGADPSRHVFAWTSAVSTRLLGRRGHFRPRLPPDLLRFRSIYDLSPTRDRLRQLVDFGRLNNGETRITIAATDMKSGDPVLFDSQRDRIEPDHILASCGFLPEFAPVQIDGRWLGDGGLSINAPFDPVLMEHVDLRLYVVDLFARDGEMPDSLEGASERKSDMMMANQTYQRLKLALVVRQFRWQLERQGAPADQIFLLSYRPGPEEAGPEKSFDFSSSGIAQRWRAGLLDMETADREFRETDGIRFVRRSSQ